jgi:hypothetical protein
MTPELELLFETQITNVSKNMSSIFSKEDVVIMLKSLRQSIDELPENTALIFTKVNVMASVKELLDEYSFDEFISCEPELNGSYGDSYSLDMNTSFDEHEFKRSFLSELEDYFTPTNQEL